MVVMLPTEVSKSHVVCATFIVFNGTLKLQTVIVKHLIVGQNVTAKECWHFDTLQQDRSYKIH